VLEQKTGYQSRHKEEAAVHRGAKSQPDQGNAGGVGLQGALDVPLPVQLSEAALDGLFPSGGIAGNIFLGLAANLLVDGVCGVPGHTLDRRRNHGTASLIGL
jgi:hypothetical protein